MGLFRKNPEEEANEIEKLIEEQRLNAEKDDAAQQVETVVDKEVDDDFGEDLSVTDVEASPEDLVGIPELSDADDDSQLLAIQEDDPRADGPFDIEEVDIDDGVTRLDLGALVVTPVPEFGMQLTADNQTNAVQSITVVWKNSALETRVHAAATSGGTAAELVDEITTEAEAADGTVEEETGPFGLQLKRVVPVKQKGKEKLFHISRIWLVEGPRWVLQATVLGEAAITDDDPKLLTPFAEFFRNLVVRRGEQPFAPGDLIPLTLPNES